MTNEQMIQRMEQINQTLVDNVTGMVDKVSQIHDNQLKIEVCQAGIGEKVARINKIVFDDNGEKSLVSSVRYLTDTVDTVKLGFRFVGKAVSWIILTVGTVVGIWYALVQLGVIK